MVRHIAASRGYPGQRAREWEHTGYCGAIKVDEYGVEWVLGWSRIGGGLGVDLWVVTAGIRVKFSAAPT